MRIGLIVVCRNQEWEMHVPNLFIIIWLGKVAFWIAILFIPFHFVALICSLKLRCISIIISRYNQLSVICFCRLRNFFPSIKYSNMLIFRRTFSMYFCNCAEGGGVSLKQNVVWFFSNDLFILTDWINNGIFCKFNWIITNQLIIIMFFFLLLVFTFFIDRKDHVCSHSLFVF